MTKVCRTSCPRTEKCFLRTNVVAAVAYFLGAGTLIILSTSAIDFAKKDYVTYNLRPAYETNCFLLHCSPNTNPLDLGRLFNVSALRSSSLGTSNGTGGPDDLTPWPTPVFRHQLNGEPLVKETINGVSYMIIFCLVTAVAHGVQAILVYFRDRITVGDSNYRAVFILDGDRTTRPDADKYKFNLFYVLGLARWVEYAVSSSLMMYVIAYTYYIREDRVLNKITGLQCLVIVFGGLVPESILFVDLYFSSSSRSSSSTKYKSSIKRMCLFILVLCAWVVGWIVYLFNWTTVKRQLDFLLTVTESVIPGEGGGDDDFNWKGVLNGIFWSQATLFTAFGFNNFLDFGTKVYANINYDNKVVGEDTRTYQLQVTSQLLYIILSFVAKFTLVLYCVTSGLQP